MNKKFYIESIFLILLGTVTSLSLPPYNYVIVNFFTFSFFFIFLIKKSKTINNKKLFFLYGWLFGFGYFISNIYWVTISLTFDESFKFLIPIALIVIPAFLAFFYGTITYLFVIFKQKKLVSSFLIFSLIFGVIEFTRGFILTGFPWNLIAYSFSNQLKIVSITSIIGTYGFNLFCISLFISPAIFFLRERKKDILVSGIFIIMISIFYIYGSSYEKKFRTSDIDIYDFKVRIIGSNVSLDRFYRDIDPVSVIKDLIEISDPRKEEKTIFVWPEGILPDISQKDLVKYNWLFNERFNDNHLLVIGINSQFNDQEVINFYNTLSIYDHNLKLIKSYNKINLVPFGEFLPFENVLKKVGLKSITNNYQSFSKGDGRDIIKIHNKNFSFKFLPLICYEIIYSGKIFKENNFDFIINISEDGWFGNSIGPNQHFAKTKFRAIENNTFVIRAANKGFSGFVNNNGKILKLLKPSESGNIEMKIPVLKSSNKNKNDLIFLILLITYISTFLIFRNEKK